MQMEPLKEVMHWTEAVHHELAHSLRETGEGRDERAQMLLNYLSEHEKQIEHLLRRYERLADKESLNSWYLEYINKEPVPDHRKITEEYREKDPEAIYHNVMMQHEKIIDLYKFMRSHAETEESRELLQQLVDLEQHEAMRMSQSANRFSDL